MSLLKTTCISLVSSANASHVHFPDYCSTFLGGIGEYSKTDLDNLFKLVDTDESGFIDKDEFDTFMDYAINGKQHCDDDTALQVRQVLQRSSKVRRMTIDSSLHSTLFTPTEEMIGDKRTIQYMEGLINDAERPLDDWSVFYCGGSTPVEKTLKGIRKKYNIGLGVEKFDW